MKKEFQIFDEFMLGRGLRRTRQRNCVLDVFISTERHVSTEELYKIVNRRYPRIGYTTVYRTMKLLSDSGLCDQTDLGDGIIRFEHKYGHRHHDHLICTKCGRYIEVLSPGLEDMQEKMAKNHGFIPVSHKLDIFGTCKKCLRPQKKNR